MNHHLKPIVFSTALFAAGLVAPAVLAEPTIDKLQPDGQRDVAKPRNAAF